MSKFDIPIWAMRRRTSESNVCLTTLNSGRTNYLQKKNHLLKSPVTYLRDKDYPRVGQDELSNYSELSSLITANGHYIHSFSSEPRPADFCETVENYISDGGYIIRRSKLQLEIRPMAEQRLGWPMKLIQCNACNPCNKNYEKENQTKVRPTSADARSERFLQSAYKMRNEPVMLNRGYSLTQSSTPSFLARDDQRQSDYSPPNSFMGIMNYLASTVIRVIYHIFLIIAQVVPVFEVFPCIYDFVVKSCYEIHNTQTQKDMLTRIALLILQVLVILVSFIFVLCAVLIPVFTLCTVVLRRLFFFI